MPAARGRTARVEARIAPEALAIVRKAAEIQGRSVSDFIVSAAQDAARQTVAEMEILRFSRKAQEQFARLILDPPRPAPALTRAFKRRRALLAE